MFYSERHSFRSLVDGWVYDTHCLCNVISQVGLAISPAITSPSATDTSSSSDCDHMVCHPHQNWIGIGIDEWNLNTVRIYSKFYFILYYSNSQFHPTHPPPRSTFVLYITHTLGRTDEGTNWFEWQSTTQRVLVDVMVAGGGGQSTVLINSRTANNEGTNKRNQARDS